MRKEDIFLKTKRKVIVLSTAIVLLSLIIFAVIIKAFYTSKVFNEADRELMQQKKQYEMSIDGNMEPQNGGPGPFMQPRIIALLYENGTIDYVRENYYFDASYASSAYVPPSDKISMVTVNGYRFRAVSIERKNITVEFMINVDAELQSVDDLMSSLIFGLMVLIIIALILSYILSSKIIKPVKDAYDKQVYFVQDASHEMRTPLAVIRGKLELLAGAWDDTVENNLDHISQMMSEVRGLEKLNSDLLLLSKEDIDGRMNCRKFLIRELVEDVGGFYYDLAEAQGKNFKAINRCRDDMEVFWDYDKVKRMIIILLENAFKYTKDNGTISLMFVDDGKSIRISVKDNGIGIREEEQKRIFDRFFRSSDIKAGNIPGSGIGLSLLKSIAATMNVKIKLISKYGEGTEFDLFIKKENRS